MREQSLSDEYRSRYEEILVPLARRIEAHLKDRIEYPRIELIRCRAKTPESFIIKSKNVDVYGEPRYSDPLNQIQDQLGARIVTYYRTDIKPISDIVKDYYGSIEEKDVVPDSEKEFDYEGKHYILLIPEAVLTDKIDRTCCPHYFELQIKTLFQHAWAQADHNIAYKPSIKLTRAQRRIVACASAQAWGADHFFEILVGDLGAASENS